jgi:polysaccharide export outer membrane protein
MKRRLSIIIAGFLIAGLEASISISAQQSKEKTITDRKIESLDMLMVHVFGEQEFSGPDNAGLELRVSSAGDISLYLLGSVKVQGKTPAEAEDYIRSLLMRDYIRNPHVLVQVKSYRTSNVTVMGQVSKPGLIALPAEQKIDILAGIAQAGGFTQLAKTSKIDLTRKGVTKTYDLDEIKKETDPGKIIWLQASDLIYVHESAF